MTVNIEYEVENAFDFDADKVITEVINEAADYEKCPYEAVVEVTITDNDRIHKMNQEFRGVDRPTDVLSFPSLEYDNAGDFSFLEQENAACAYFDPESGELILGDIVISADKVKQQAQEYNHSIKRELGFLVAHSMLHLFGYDHMSEAQAAVMERKQADILNRLGITRELA